MSDLPDQLRDWPDDPYELLGIGYDVDERAARKAYLRLVRRFKPDFYPDHFQRIREAYDTVLAQLSYRVAVDSNNGNRGDTRSEHEGGFPPPRQAPSDALHDEAWGDAMQGRERDAYSKLVRLYQRGENVPEACLRLYWLHKAIPELDASTDPRHWLVEGLCATRLTGPMYDLYEREIVASPEEATTARCDKLLTVDAEPGRLYDLIQIRWRAFDQLEEFLRITDDLASFKEGLVFQHELLWNRLLLLAANHLAWGDPHAWRHFQHVKEAIAGTRFLHRELDFELDRLDLLIEITDRGDALRFGVEFPFMFAELVEHSWTQPYENYEATFERVVTAIALDPQRGLRHLDSLKRSNQAAASYLVDLIRSHHHIDYRTEFTASERAKDAAKRFVYGLKKSTYDAARSSLLHVALEEAASPELLARFADEALGNRGRDAWWTAAANSDVAIQGVYHAYRIVWG